MPSTNVYLAAESDLATVLGHVTDVDPTLLIVDSVQTMIATDADGVHGGVTQIRAVTTALVSLAKNTGVAVVPVGHVTSDGAVAGRRSLEHLVDVVLSFGATNTPRCGWCAASRTVSAPPTRWGCFEQRDNGIHQVTDPSGIFLAPAPGRRDRLGGAGHDGWQARAGRRGAGVGQLDRHAQSTPRGVRPRRRPVP